MQGMMAHFAQEKEKKLNCFRQQNVYIRKGQTLFTGSSLMEQFPITEFCLNEGLPIAYNRGIGGYTTDEFLAAIDAVLLDPEPKKLFINIGTNDIREMPNGEDWMDHLSGNYRRICEIIKEKLPETVVYMMAYYPVCEEIMREKFQTPPVRTNEAVRKANRMVKALANEFGYSYIDVNDGLKDPQGGLKAEHTMDGIHFDAAAYRTVFDRLKQYLLSSCR
ncbi:MAG: lysophospholipase [Clostridia bacterium]|nr:lysophospholipase [Clostridia bacterium]